jgi:ABC-2 type transport system ATP-binding protein
MIEVQGLTKRYGANVAIENVTFSVERGGVVGFLGPNGAGKSTTMRVIAGSLGASSGTAKVGGIDVAENPRAVQAMLGYSPEVPPVYTNMTVRDYVNFAATIKGVEDVPKATDRALDRVGLTKVGGKLIDHLSKGYRQRVGLAQSLVHDPKVLVLDEPTSGLDPAQRVEIRELIRELAAGDRTVILSTHVLGEIEAICNRVVVINRGRILVDDDIKNLAAAGKIVRLELARPSDLARSALAAVEGVESVELTGTTAVVRSQADIREQLAAAAVPFGLLELGGRERLEDIYLRLIGAQGAA